jgi:hypothetical protein
MKKYILLVLVIVGLCLFINKPIHQKKIKKEESEAMLLEVNGYTFEVELENNTSAKALKEYVSKEKRTLSLDDYGNFEKEGNLGITLPRNDETITTKEGDLILYLGNKLCLYYNQNTWDFTKLSHIKDTTHLKEVLGKGSVQVALLMK